MPIGRRPAVQGAGEGPRAPSCSGMTLTRTPIFVTLGGWRRSFPLARPLAFGRPWRATASRATRPRSSASASCRKGPSGSGRTSRSVDRIYAKPLGVLGPFARQLDKKLTTTWIAYRGSLVEAVLKRSSILVRTDWGPKKPSGLIIVQHQRFKAMCWRRGSPHFSFRGHSGTFNNSQYTKGLNK